MNKYLQLPIDAQIVRYPEQTSLRLTFHREAIRDWCLGLCLLKERFVEALILDGRKANAIRLHLSTLLQTGGTARVNFGSDAIYVALTSDSLGYIASFFLKYFRDGIAEVDHLDIEGIDESNGEKEVYVTFQVPDSRTPLSPEEAIRRLPS